MQKLSELTPILSDTKHKARDEELSEIFNIIGFGKWHIFIIVTYSIIYAVFGSHSFVAVLLSFTIPFRCYLSEEYLQEFNAHNCSQISSSNESSDFYDSKCLNFVEISSGGEDHCLKINSPDLLAYRTTGLQDCPAVTYDPTYLSGVTSEFHLICNNGNSQHLFQTVYAIGQLFGSLLGGTISESCGPRKTILIGSILHSLSICIALASFTLGGIYTGRFFIGFTTLLILVPTTSYVIESSPVRQRGLICLLSFIPFSVWLMFMAAIAFLVSRWRIVYFIVSFPAVLIVPIAFFLDESPRWLMSNGRIREAERVFIKAYIINNPIDGNEMVIKDRISAMNNYESIPVVDEENKDNRTNNEASLAKSFKSVVNICIGITALPRTVTEQCNAFLSRCYMRVITVLSSISRGLLTIVQVAILFHADVYRYSPVIFVAFSGVIYCLGSSLGLILCRLMSKKHLAVIAMIFSGIFSFSVVGLFTTNLTTLRWIFHLISFYMATVANMAFWTYFPELFPTSLRSSGLSLINFMGQLGFLFGPLVPALMVKGSWWGTSSAIGCLSVLTGVFVAFLPETSQSAISDDIDDIERRKLG